MRNEFTAVLQKTQGLYIAYCLEMPGATGQGKTLQECRESLKQAIVLLLDDLREKGLRDVPADAIVETVTVDRGVAS